jgi:hypothetical protein
MRGVAGGWTADALATWQSGAYRKLARLPRDSALAPRVSSARPIVSLTDLLRESRWKVFAALEEATIGHVRFVQRVAGERLIVRDADLGWVPVDRQGATLHGRVLSLFAVDCMLRPHDYGSVLFACPRCESVVFSEEAKRQGRCCSDQGAGSGRASLRTSDFRLAGPAVPDGKQNKR